MPCDAGRSYTAFRLRPARTRDEDDEKHLIIASVYWPGLMLAFTTPPTVVACVLLAVAAVAAIYDLRWRRIPNWLTASGVIAGLALNTYLGHGWPGLQFALSGLLVAFVVYFALYAIRAMGSGDVKLMAAIGAMTGWFDWVGIFLISALLGGVAALVLVIWRKRLKKTLRNVGFVLTEMKSGRPAYLANEELDVRSQKGLGLPHGAVIAVSTLIFLAVTLLSAR